VTSWEFRIIDRTNKQFEVVRVGSGESVYGQAPNGSGEPGIERGEVKDDRFGRPVVTLILEDGQVLTFTDSTVAGSLRIRE
jgi:hypothetical protein